MIKRLSGPRTHICWTPDRIAPEQRELVSLVRESELVTLERELDKLAQYFRDEAPSDGFEGDVEGWSPVDTAIVVMRRNRNAERLAAHVGAKPDDKA